MNNELIMSDTDTDLHRAVENWDTEAVNRLAPLTDLTIGVSEAKSQAWQSFIYRPK